MIQDDLGIPASVRAIVEAFPALKVHLREPAQSIAASSVVLWHEWGGAVHGSWPRLAAGEMLGWRNQGGQYGSFHLTREDLARLGCREVKEQWRCEIQDVEGLSASKSELRDFASLDDMVATNSRPMIEPMSLEKLDQNLAWSEIRILHREDPSVSNSVEKFPGNSVQKFPVAQAFFTAFFRCLKRKESLPVSRISQW
ncbi:DUF6685 family protein [Pseudomonas aeruginosa]|uniref:DUF6685 family protein n=1 Tax=Pseudomonas aeruginosa TaxID=287 RepID=UPI00104ECDEF|nr:DUF6685 family protein [Pseudomonas aeruginosa]